MPDASSPANPPFPADFVWGVATSAYQIEGAVAEDGRGESIWDTFCRTPGKVANGDTGAVACDHYHRWESDLDLIASLGVNAYRFSIAWPRIVPEGRGRIEPRGLDFYDRLVDGMLDRGLAPYATLYHWDLPQALEDEGGWTNRDIVDAFVAYADAVTARLGDRVASWATLNEPWCSAFLGYVKGEHAPGRTSVAAGLRAAHHLLLAHGSALPVMRRNAPGSEHGIVLNLNPVYPASDSPADAAAAHRFDGFFNRWYLEPILHGSYPEDAWEGYGDVVPDVESGDLEVIAREIDFLGVNYYSRVVVADGDGPWPSTRGVPGSGPVTGMGWEVYPQGLTDLLVRLDRDYSIPRLHITENGAAYRDERDAGRVRDADRVRYFEEHVAAVATARAQGVPAAGYFAWSLMDNFEWAYGYDKRFGIVHVDYDTQERTLKDSARWYRDWVRASRGTSRRDRATAS